MLSFDKFMNIICSIINQKIGKQSAQLVLIFHLWMQRKSPRELVLLWESILKWNLLLRLGFVLDCNLTIPNAEDRSHLLQNVLPLFMMGIYWTEKDLAYKMINVCIPQDIVPGFPGDLTMIVLFWVIFNKFKVKSHFVVACLSNCENL